MITVYAQGGRGNTKLVGFSSNRDAKITLQDAIFDNKAVAMLTGNDPTAGVKVVDKREIVTVTSNTATLSKTPQGAITSVYLLKANNANGTKYTLGTPATNPTDFSISGKVITFNSGIVNGTQFRVYYKVNTDATATIVKVSSDKFGGTFRVALDVLVRDEFTKKDFMGQLQIPNAKFEDNFNLAFAADGELIAV